MRATRAVGLTASLALVLLACSGPDPQQDDAPRDLHDLVDSTTIILRGHHELTTRADGVVVPVVFDEGELGLCFEVPAAVNTSHWDATLWLESHPDDRHVSEPVRLGRTTCFDRPPGPMTEATALCGTLRHGFTGEEVTLPCLSFEARPRPAEYGALLQEMGATFRQAASLPIAELAQRFEDLASRAEAGGHLVLASRLRMIAIYQERRSGVPEALDAATARAARAPEWFDEPAAHRWAALWSHERSQLALARGWDLEDALRHSREAARRFRLVADHLSVSSGMLEADILARAGAVDEACHLLRTRLAECATAACDPKALGAGKTTLAWLLIQSPDPEPRDVDEALLLLREALDVAVGNDLERANVLVNLAHASALAGEDPDESLTEAEALYGPSLESGSEKARGLARWALAARALFAHTVGDEATALALCEQVGSDPALHRLAAWGQSCASDALRRQGRLDLAAEANERALLLHSYATRHPLAHDVVVGLTRRAEDLYRGIRLALERDDDARLQSLLAEVDRLDAARPCTTPTDPALTARWKQLIGELVALEGPASGRWREQRRAPERAVRRELQDLARSVRCEDEGAPMGAESGPSFRAIPLEDEVLLLRRDATGRTTLHRRTSLPRRELRSRLDRIHAELAGVSVLDDRGWRELVAPIAAALVPSPEDLDTVTSFALHGPLQSTPLAALPLPGDTTRFLCDATVPVHWVPRRAAPSATSSRTTSPPLFVVDPSGDLPGARRSLATYQRLAPDGRFLVETAAERDEVLGAIPTARWLHVDAHARFEPGFPELSSLLLADGPLTVPELTRQVAGLELANLSGCSTGRSPVSAGTGRYGLAGALVRAGVPSVVAAGTALSDETAPVFNGRFHAALAEGEGAAAAFGAGVREARNRLPAARWAPLMLVGSGRGTSPRSENQSVVTPPLMRRGADATRPPERQGDQG